MDLAVRRAARLSGEVTPPGDKSISHRALIFNAIARGQGQVHGLTTSADCLSTARCLRALGVSIPDLPAGVSVPAFTIAGAGKGGLREPVDVLDAGNSGTTMRILSGLLAGQPFFSVLTGDVSLRSRPMGRVIEPLRRMGAQIRGRARDTLAPLAIRGGDLKGISYRLPVASAQLKTALLVAGLHAEGETVIEEPSLSRDHTERMFAAMGADLRREGASVRIRPGELRSASFTVPGDISAAAFWLVAACIHPNASVRVRGVGVNPTRTGVLDALRMMGAKVRVENERTEGGEPVADLVAESGGLRGIEVGGELAPRLIDEAPVLMVAAAVATGKTTFRNCEELRIKESDRIAVMAQALTKLGVRVEELPDGAIVHGGAALAGAEVESAKDHRIAMSMAVAGLVATGQTTIRDAECVAISYPTFWRDMERVAGAG